MIQHLGDTESKQPSSLTDSSHHPAMLSQIQDMLFVSPGSISRAKHRVGNTGCARTGAHPA